MRLSAGRTWASRSASKRDLIDTDQAATSVLKAGYVLAVAGEGRLSDREGAIVPLEEGGAFFALRAGVPIVPMAIIGARWLRFGETITMRGRAGHRARRAAARPRGSGLSDR